MPMDKAAAQEVLNKQSAEYRKNIDEGLKRMETGKPTPTQEENDLARLGVSLENHEDDGSGPELVRVTVQRPLESKQMEPQTGRPAAQQYQTRQSTAKPTSS